MHRISVAILSSALLLTAGMAACPDPARAPQQEAPQAKGTAAAPAQAASDLPADTVVATVEGEKVTLGTIDGEISSELKQAQTQYLSQIHDLREQAIERYIAKKLLTEEAKRRGLKDDEALIQQEIEKGTPAPTEEEIKAFYDQNQARMGGAAFDQVKPRIKDFLWNQKKREAFGKLMEDLRGKAKVEVDLPSPTVTVEAKGPALGPKDAPVTIVAFSDFQCPYCARAVPTIHKVHDVYGDKVRIVFRNFPLPFHENAKGAAAAGVCAAAQGKFWELHDKMFENQQQLDEAGLKKLAGEVGLDEAKFAECLKSADTTKEVDADIAAGKAAGVTGTPAFFVNGVMISGAQPFDAFKDAIDKALQKKGVATN